MSLVVPTEALVSSHGVQKKQLGARQDANFHVAGLSSGCMEGNWSYKDLNGLNLQNGHGKIITGFGVDVPKFTRKRGMLTQQLQKSMREMIQQEVDRLVATEFNDAQKAAYLGPDHENGEKKELPFVQISPGGLERDQHIPHELVCCQQFTSTLWECKKYKNHKYMLHVDHMPCGGCHDDPSSRADRLVAAGTSVSRPFNGDSGWNDICDGGTIPAAGSAPCCSQNLGTKMYDQNMTGLDRASVSWPDSSLHTSLSTITPGCVSCSLEKLNHNGARHGFTGHVICNGGACIVDRLVATKCKGNKFATGHRCPFERKWHGSRIAPLDEFVCCIFCEVTWLCLQQCAQKRYPVRNEHPHSRDKDQVNEDVWQYDQCQIIDCMYASQVFWYSTCGALFCNEGYRGNDHESKGLFPIAHKGGNQERRARAIPLIIAWVGQCINIFWCTVEDGMSNKAQLACDFVCPDAATALPWRVFCSQPIEPVCSEFGSDVVEDVLFAATLNAKPFFDEVYSLHKAFNQLVEACDVQVKCPDSPCDIHYTRAGERGNCWLDSYLFCDTLSHVEVRRFGEASHPGPIVIRTFNPAQLLGHEEDICKWPDGIWTAAETSHTAAAMHVMRQKFQKHDVKTLFGPPVEKHSGNAGSYRGKAMGTAIMTRCQMTPYPMELDESVRMSCRFNDAIVHVGYGLRVYVCVVYAPPINNYTYMDGEKVFWNALLPGLQRATCFKGPAVITGDFNRDLGDCVFWESLRAKGWYDCAELAWQRFQKIPEPTCKDASRRSFILVNETMAQFFQDCGTVEHHMFDAHPVLEATFSIGQTQCYKTVWSLPRSLDNMMFDSDEMERLAVDVCSSRHSKFSDALQRGDANEALRQFALAFEDVVRDSAVDVEGNHVHVPAACFKRCQGKVVKTKPVSAHIIPKGRDGDVQASIGQTTLGVKRRVTQCRRILSLVRQLKARSRCPTAENLMQCTMLWKAIWAAPGFHKGFSTWILDNLGWFVPMHLPDVVYVEGLYDAFHEVVQSEVKGEKYAQLKQFNKITLEDLAKGGGKAFKAVREKSAPPPTFLMHTVQQPIARQRWSLQGLQKLRYKAPCVLQIGMPVQFQGQDVMLVDADDEYLFLDRPVRCKSMDNPVVSQSCAEPCPNKMQDMVCQAWNQFWQAPDVVTNEAAEFIRSLSDCPSCPFQDFNVDAWRKCIKGVKVKSARGACGFSMKDVQRMPETLMQWLFQIYRAAENGMPWPDRTSLARVVMLAKPGEDNHRPLSVRPITIVSVLYRLWSRYRSLQVIQHLGNIVPPQVGGVASRLSADRLTALVCDVLEEAHYTGSHKCGLVIDLQKCFNLIPRTTLALLMQKLQIPMQYPDAICQRASRHVERVETVSGYCRPDWPRTTQQLWGS